MIFTIRIATVLMILCVECETSPAPTSPSLSASSVRKAFNTLILQSRFDNQLCGSCLKQGLKCPAGCSKRCLPNWWICGGPKKPSGYTNTCCNGWRCVQPKNPSLKSKRCEPKPTPKPSCIKKWYHCNGSVGCCGGWRCIRPNNAPNFRGRRCEPPARIDGCVPNWWHCRGPKNRFARSTCCGGWRCKRVNKNGFNGHRCEPR